jgi:hypothetical protein
MILSENVQNAVKKLTQATLNEYTNYDGRKCLEFQFNSPKADFAKLVEYKADSNKYIIQFRKKDKLIYENFINPDEFSTVFEKVTGVSLDYYLNLF